VDRILDFQALAFIFKKQQAKPRREFSVIPYEFSDRVRDRFVD
jgi:hypothetical protein